MGKSADIFWLLFYFVTNKLLDDFFYKKGQAF
jgi:hypothetical protein